MARFLVALDEEEDEGKKFAFRFAITAGARETEGKEQRMSEADPNNTSAGPLAGLLVVDFTNYISGPLATMTLADHGARVIKIEPAFGDPFRHVGCTHATHPDLFDQGVSAVFQLYNRGKADAPRRW